VLATRRPTFLFGYPGKRRKFKRREFRAVPQRFHAVAYVAAAVNSGNDMMLKAGMHRDFT
jgi:hypothetical protein